MSDQPSWSAPFSDEPYSFDMSITDGVVFVGTPDHEGCDMSPAAQRSLYDQLKTIYEGPEVGIPRG